MERHQYDGVQTSPGELQGQAIVPAGSGSACWEAEDRPAKEENRMHSIVRITGVICLRTLLDDAGEGDYTSGFLSPLTAPHSRPNR